MKKILFFLLTLFAFQQASQAQSCGVPTGITASPVGDFTATISWSPVSGAVWYSIRYRLSAGPGSWTTGSTSTTSKALIGLSPGTQYDVEVQTHCTGSSSAYSATNTFTTTNTCVFPVNLNITSITSNSATANWNPVGAASYYQIRYREAVGPGAWISGTSGTTSKGLASLAQGTQYDVQVRTVCSGGNSPWSIPVQFTTACGNIQVRNIVSSYSKTLNHADGTTRMYEDSANKCALLARIVDTPANNVLGNTTVSSDLNSTVQTGVHPFYTYGRRDFTITSGSNGSGGLKLYFSQADFNDYNANNATFLDLPASGNNADPAKFNMRIAKVSGPSTTIYDSVLTWNSVAGHWEADMDVNALNGTYYFYTMSDCIGVNVSGLAVSSITGSSMTATWSPVVSPAFGWYSLRIENVTDNPGVWIDLGTANNNATSKNIVGLTPNKNYNLQIRRHCSAQSEGAWSASQNFSTPNTCFTPTGVNMTNVTASGARINWTSVPGIQGYSTRYRVASPVGSWVNGTASASATFKNIVGLTPSTTYDVQVAVNCAGYQSPFSSIIQFTTPASKPSGNEIMLDEENQVMIYPNPAKESVNLNIQQSIAGNIQIVLSDLSGKEISRSQHLVEAGNTVIPMNISSLASGVYMIQLSSDNGMKYVSKLTKE